MGALFIVSHSGMLTGLDMANDNFAEPEREVAMITYTLAAIGAGVIIALGVPLTPAQEEVGRFREEARRHIDRISH
jgi:hypothetical protein